MQRRSLAGDSVVVMGTGLRARAWASAGVWRAAVWQRQYDRMMQPAIARPSSWSLALAGACVRGGDRGGRGGEGARVRRREEENNDTCAGQDGGGCARCRRGSRRRRARQEGKARQGRARQRAGAELPCDEPLSVHPPPATPAQVLRGLRALLLPTAAVADAGWPTNTGWPTTQRAPVRVGRRANLRASRQASPRHSERPTGPRNSPPLAPCPNPPTSAPAARCPLHHREIRPATCDLRLLGRIAMYTTSPAE